MKNIDTLEAILRKVNLYSDYGEDEGMSVEQALKALNLYIEGKIKAAELRALGKYEYGERLDKLDEAGIEILITYHEEQLSKLRAAKRASGLK